MIRRLCVMVFVLAGALSPTYADACSCVKSGELACDAALGADAVFLGRVVSTEGQRTVFAVVEAFRNVRQPQVMLARRGSSCDYTFQSGESWVVYARRDSDGQLFASICGRTRAVAFAGDDLAILRSLAVTNPRNAARIDGDVRLWQWPEALVGRLEPVRDVLVTASGGGRTVSTRANDRGEFRLTGLSVGVYRLTATAPAGYAAIAETVEIPETRGCASAALHVRYDGRVTGRVVDSRGRAVGGLPLHLVRPEKFGTLPPNVLNALDTWTRSDGTFAFTFVEPGNYQLEFSAARGANGEPTALRAFHPGVLERTNATTVALATGARTRLADFVVPNGIALASVTGVVVDESGKPVPRAQVVFKGDADGTSSTPLFVTGDDGRFALTLTEGARYVVRATRDGNWATEAEVTQVPLAVASPTPPLTIVVKANGK